MDVEVLRVCPNGHNDCIAVLPTGTCLNLSAELRFTGIDNFVTYCKIPSTESKMASRFRLIKCSRRSRVFFPSIASIATSAARKSLGRSFKTSASPGLDEQEKPLIARRTLSRRCQRRRMRYWGDVCEELDYLRHAHSDYFAWIRARSSAIGFLEVKPLSHRLETCRPPA
jgi:hypothetical protein